MRKFNINIALAILIFLIVSITTIRSIPVFADGTQHVWIVEYVYRNGRLPLEDITGTQPAYFNVPRSIINNNPFLYQPLFYVLAGYFTLLTRMPELSVNIINILSALLSSVMIYILTKNLIKKRIYSEFAFILCLVSNIWVWMFAHRIIEPFVILLSIFSLYSLTRPL